MAEGSNFDYLFKVRGRCFRSDVLLIAHEGCSDW